jgi:phosphatidylserine decarboxylase
MLRDAYPFLVLLGALAVVAALLGWAVAPGFYVAAVIFLLLTLFVAYFFRNPERAAPDDQSLVVSPADGRVVIVRPLDPADPQAGTFVSIFLSVFDVHVNRSPIAGRIVDVKYQAGKFLNAMSHHSSAENEQNVVTVENDKLRVVFKQIAGVIARRIVFWKKVGDSLALGERVGLIKFGSRTDLHLPPQVSVTVRQGEKVVGGVTIIGKVIE